MRFRNTRTGRTVELTADEAAAAGIPSKHKPPKRGHRWEPVGDDEVEPVGDDEVEPVGDDEVDEPKPADVRRWARENGHDVPARGTIPADVVDAYKTAHGDG